MKKSFFNSVGRRCRAACFLFLLSTINLQPSTGWANTSPQVDSTGWLAYPLNLQTRGSILLSNPVSHATILLTNGVIAGDVEANNITLRGTNLFNLLTNLVQIASQPIPTNVANIFSNNVFAGTQMFRTLAGADGSFTNSFSLGPFTFSYSTNYLVSTNAGTSDATGNWTFVSAIPGYTNLSTAAYRKFAGGQWSTYNYAGLELYRGTNGAALGVIDTPINGGSPGPGFAIGWVFNLNTGTTIFNANAPLLNMNASGIFSGIFSGDGSTLLNVGYIGNNNSFLGGAGNPNLGGSGAQNVGIGNGALQNTFGEDNNTAVGVNALTSSTLGANNTAIGDLALDQLQIGYEDIAIGHEAGHNYAYAESGNIAIGNEGVVGDNNITRIGTSQTDAYIAGILHANGGGVSNVQPTTIVAGALPSNVTNTAPVNGTNIQSGTIPVSAMQIPPITNNQSGVTLDGTFTGSGNGLTNTPSGALTASNATITITPTTNPTTGKTNYNLSLHWNGYPRYITNFSSLQFTNLGAVSNAVATWFPTTNTFLSLSSDVGITYNYAAQCRVWITFSDIKGATNAFPLVGEPANSISMSGNVITNFSISTKSFWVSTNAPVTVAFVNGAGTNIVWYDFSLEQKHP